MAGHADAIGRRLRGRDVVAPPPPLTRAAAAASNKIARQQQQVEARRTKVAPKRAAIDDNNRGASSTTVQHAKKRAALANLTNTSSAACNAAPKAKAAVQARIKSHAIPQAQRKEFEVVQTISGPSLKRNSEAGSSITFQQDENVFFSTGTGSLDVKAGLTLHTESNGSKVLLALERKTQHTLHISNESRLRARQGCLFDDPLEAEGWSCKNFTDIDSDHVDPQMCASYAPEIYHHLRVAELKRRPATDFMEVIQLDINVSMRAILVDWLVEVAEEYKLVPDTLYLTISYVDRFLSGNVVNRQRLQLLGVSCMLIASKYEEICAPQVEEFCYITDNTYGREEVLEMERRILNHLRFELTGPTTKTFIRRFIRAAQAGQKVPSLQMEFLGNYLAELTLVEYCFLQYLPSMIAGSAVFLARVTLDPGNKPWNSTLVHYSGYKAAELKDCVQAIHSLQRNTKNCSLPAIREKYRQHKFKCVANLAPPLIVPPEFFDDL